MDIGVDMRERRAMTLEELPIAFENSYAESLEGFYVPTAGDRAPAPSFVYFGDSLAAELGLNAAVVKSDAGARLLSGGYVPKGAKPLAMAYAGHQFGGFSPQLGDGRALLLGELIDVHGGRRDVHLKGSGKTPFSRGGDGKAALGPVLREVIFGEAMHAFGIPTTRALAAIATGETVDRIDDLPGAVLVRVAASHLRVGTFQYFAAQGDTARVRQLADYAISRHFPELVAGSNKYLLFLRAVVDHQAALIAQWMLVGFIHGVMNTDNMTISGETIDYGPCAFMDAYDSATVFSSIDRQGRYAYGNQPAMARWNIARLAETLLPLLGGTEEEAIARATAEIDRFTSVFDEAWLAQMRAKLGISGAEPGDLALANDLLALLQEQSIDFTRFFRALYAEAAGKATVPFLFAAQEGIAVWLGRWSKRRENAEREALPRMAAVNPVYVPRNHLVEEAIAAAVAGDFAPFHTLIDLLRAPFDARDGFDRYAFGAPQSFYPYRTFCGT